LLSYNLKLSVYKNPLSLFKIKIEIIKGDKIVVYNIHLVALLAYKSNRIFKKTSNKIEKLQILLKIGSLNYKIIKQSYQQA
jgi:hypothetical protein